jgi:hypothetical protein
LLFVVTVLLTMMILLTASTSALVMVVREAIRFRRPPTSPEASESPALAGESGSEH